MNKFSIGQVWRSIDPTVGIIFKIVGKQGKDDRLCHVIFDISDCFHDIEPEPFMQIYSKAYLEGCARLLTEEEVNKYIQIRTEMVKLREDFHKTGKSCKSRMDRCAKDMKKIGS